ncbi:MAG: AI-2E family transporter [Gemmatimonadota bacterium]|nr:AI-2E family transporter [Gemmatimonadota bacterium]
MPPLTLPRSRREQAAVLILVLATGIVITLAPYATGLLGGLVLYVLFSPVHALIGGKVAPRTAAALVVATAMALILGVTAGFAVLVANQAQDIAGALLRSRFFEGLSSLEVYGYPVGPRLAQALEEGLAWLGGSAFGLLGTATRIGLNLTIALFILYYLLLRAQETWAAVVPYIPFSPRASELLRHRFHDITVSSVIGIGMIATTQGIMLGSAFWLTGLANPVFWGTVTVVFGVLPIVGSGLVWIPAAAVLVMDERMGSAIFMSLIGVAAGNVDVVIRPLIFRRYANIHPLVTLVGAIAGIGYFGLLGILIGPLALSYFLQLLQIYRDEYGVPAGTAAASAMSPVASEPPAA